MQVNIQDPNNYKLCKKKQYSIYVCMPARGTFVINKLEQSRFAAQYPKHMYSPGELEKNPTLKARLMQLAANNEIYVTNDNTPFVLAGTLGEMWAINGAKLSQRYLFANGAPINEMTLRQKLTPSGLLDWTKVTTVPDMSTAFACFVPLSQKGQVKTAWGAILDYNGAGVTHGKGDFIIASNVNGMPNLNDIYVVNGAIFRDTYDNRGWEPHLDLNSQSAKKIITINDLPKIR